MSAWAYYTMRANASSQGSEAHLDINRQPWSQQLSQFSQSHIQSQPSLHNHHNRQPSEHSSQNVCRSWSSLNPWGTGWLSWAVETVQTKLWYYRTGQIGGLDFERTAEENEHRREERFIAASEGRRYYYDS